MIDEVHYWPVRIDVGSVGSVRVGRSVGLFVLVDRNWWGDLKTP
jgi:hypothetical protein